MQTRFYDSPDIPIFLRNSLIEIRKHLGVTPFLSGGCGILAAALASACQARHIPCHLSVIHRHNPIREEDTLSHIALVLPDGDQSIDINGHDAEPRWVEYFCSVEEALLGQSVSEFRFEDIEILPHSKPALCHLQRLTREYELKLPVSGFYEQTMRCLDKVLKQN